MNTIILPGYTGYSEALALQESLVQEQLNSDNAPSTLIMLEHEPIYTIGRTRDTSSLHQQNTLPHPAHTINRGGQATYHGPGQLVGYPIINLNHYRPDLHWYVTVLEQAIINTCQDWGIEAIRRESYVGVWVGSRKIASIGVGMKKWITMHGFALNVTQECLSGFHHITPCGISGVEMTSMEQELAQCPTNFIQEVRDRWIIHFKSLLNQAL